MSNREPRPLSIVIAAMGGQGGGVLSSWIVDVAEHNGYLAQATSVPGVAQRTGATIYYIELFPEQAAREAGRDPVLALMPIPGQVDVVIAAELMEAGRAVLRGLVSRERTTVVASSHREYSVAEKMVMGDGIADGTEVLKALETNSNRCITFDMASLAHATESVISSVLFGALAGAAPLPFEREHYESAIRRSGIAVEKNLAGFSAGFDGATSEGSHVRHDGVEHTATATKLTSRAKVLLDRIDEKFPKATIDLVVEGVRRLADYQDFEYASAYLDRIEQVLATDNGGADDTYRLTADTARHLALWMSYEDAVRVADLKTRSARFPRGREEVGAAPDQLVHVVEFLHPRVEEISDILPAPIGSFVMRNRGVRNLLGKIFGHGRQVPTTKLRGFLLLYFLAGLRRWRRMSYRYKREMALIDRWLARILDAARSNYDLAVEIARSQRLIKGYGDTHSNGMKNFAAIMNALDGLGADSDAAAAVRELTEAALADEDGRALEAALDR